MGGGGETLARSAECGILSVGFWYGLKAYYYWAAVWGTFAF
jgi:hypothetical protein